MRKIKLILLTIALFPIGQPAYSQDSLTLEQAMDIAREKNPLMIEAGKGIVEAQGNYISERSLPNPEVEFEAGGFKRNEEGARDSNLDSFEVRQGFDPPGVRGLKSGIARNEIVSRREDLKSVWAQVYADVRDTYSKIKLDRKQLELAETNLNTFRQFFGKVQVRFQAGKTLQNEVQRAKIEVLKAENNYLAAERELTSDMGRLNVLLGRDFDTAFEISEELSADDLAFDLQKLTTTALAQRPDLKAQEIELDSKRKAVTKEKLNLLPSPFIGFSRTTEEYENDSSVLFGFSVPFWNWNRGEIKRARARKEAQEVRLEALKRQISFDVYQAFLNARYTGRQMDLLKKSIEEAHELLRLADLRYSEGEIDFINYLDQVRTVNETRVRYYEGLFALNSAVTQLEKTVYSSVRKEDFLK